MTFYQRHSPLPTFNCRILTPTVKKWSLLHVSLTDGARLSHLAVTLPITLCAPSLDLYQPWVLGELQRAYKQKAFIRGWGGYNDTENWALSIQKNLKLRKIPNGTVLSGCTVPTQVNTRLVRRVWSSVTGYGELCMCFQPVRIGEIF